VFLCTVKYYKCMLYSCLFVVLLTCIKLIQAKILVSLVYIIFIYSYLTSMYDNGLLLLMIVHTHTCTMPTNKTNQKWFLYLSTFKSAHITMSCT